MPSPANYTFSVYQGQTWQEPLLLKNADGTAMDLTGYQARMHIRADIADSTTVLELDADNDRLEVTDPTAGEITLSVTAEDMAALPLDHEIQVWVYDLEIFIPEQAGPPVVPEIVYRVLAGAVVAYPEVTRD